MQPYAQKLKERLQQRGTISIQGAAIYMYQMVVVWSDAMREERMIGRNAFTRWLELYPEMFTVVGAAPRQRVRLA